jgi:hypothetical protein
MATSQALVKYRVHKSSNELQPSKDVVIRDAATGEPVVWEPIECEVPVWFATTVDRIDRNLLQFNNLVQECRAHNYEFATAFPVLTQQYEVLLDNQQKIYELARKETENMQYLQEEAFLSLTIASTQFADQVAAAMLAAQASDQKQFLHLSEATEKLAESSRHIMTVVDDFAARKDAEIKRLQKASRATKKELSNLRQEMEESKEKESEEQDRRMQQFFDEAVKKAKEAANSIQFVSELEELARSVRKGKSREDLPVGRSAPPEDPDEGPSRRPFHAKDWALYDSDEDYAGASGGAGGGGGGGAGGRGGAKSPPGSPSDTSSDDDDAKPRRKRSPARRSPSTPPRKPRERKRSPSPPPRKPRDPVRITIEKPVLDKPEKFSGRDAKPTFAAWWARINKYFEYYEGTYVKETDKISFVGHRMSGNAEEWFESRAAQLKRLKKEDDWKAFSSAIEARFHSRFEQRDALRKIDRIVYDGDIELYIDKMDIANTRACLSGVIWREKLKAGLTKPMRKKLSNVGRLPEDDVEFVEVLREVGKNLEDELREEGRSHRKSPEPKNPKKSSRSSEVKDHNSSYRVNKKTGKKGDKGDKGDKGSNTKKEQRYKTKEDATKGVDPKLVDKRFKNNDCLACGKPNHRWFQCRGPIVTTSSRTVAGKKRRIPDSAIEEEEAEKTQHSAKRAKVAARGVARDDSPEPPRYAKRIPAWEKKLFEEDSEKESD